MTRRDFITLLGAAATAWPLAARAQQPGKPIRIGILSPAQQTSTKSFDAFREGLRELGYVDGKNITIEYRLAAGDLSRLPAMAADLVRLPVAVIVTDGPKAGELAHEATRTIPIVMATVDPVAAGLAASYPHPGGNVTGFDLQLVELNGKRLQLLKEAFPAISRVAVLLNPESNLLGLGLRSTEEAARALGVQLRPVEIAAPEGIAAGFEAAIAGGAEALAVLGDAMFWNHREQIVALAAKSRRPAIYPEREFAVAGGLLSYGPNVADNFRRAAGYVDKILKGAKPGDLPVQRPAKFDFVVNLKTARGLGLTVPPTVLARADEVIE